MVTPRSNRPETPSTAAALPADLTEQIDACGYFPEFVCDSVAMALGEEEVVAHLVHHEATFSLEEITRHLTVLVVTPTRLLVAHTDDGPAMDTLGRPISAPRQTDQAVTSVEAAPLSSLGSVVLSRAVSSPQSYGHGGSQVVETWLTLGWGTMRRLDLEPAGCSDPNCDADHGYTGSMVGDDITIRMSSAADGADNVRRLVEFGNALQRLTGRA